MSAPDATPAKDFFARVGGHRARQRPRSQGGRIVTDLGRAGVRGRTKAELLAVARRIALPGRSRMTKAELARALAKHH